MGEGDDFRDGGRELEVSSAMDPAKPFELRGESDRNFVEWKFQIRTESERAKAQNSVFKVIASMRICKGTTLQSRPGCPLRVDLGSALFLRRKSKSFAHSNQADKLIVADMEGVAAPTTHGLSAA